MKVSFIIPCRNKAPHVVETIQSVFAQCYSPIEIILSDQGSIDGTSEIINKLAGEYDGPHSVHVLSCPHTDLHGMPGLNAHLNWLDTQIQGDIVIMSSADDINHPDRTEYTVRAFKEYDPSYVNTTVRYIEPDGSDPKFTNFPNIGTRWIGIEESIRHQIHSSGSSAWARDLFQKHGPLIGCEQQDMILPMMALFERGIFYIDTPLHTYIHHSSRMNTGFQGQIKAAESDEERIQLVELNNFIHVRNWTSVLNRWQQQPDWLLKLAESQGDLDAFLEKIATTSYAWSTVREAMILNGIRPLQMNIGL